MASFRFPSWLGHLLKAGVAAGVLTAMFRSGKLQPEVLARAAHRWPDLLLAAAMIFTVVLICALRWRLLLHGQGFAIGMRQSISLTMIGVLFSAVIPGAVSGDLVKGYYLHKEVSGRRTLAVATILMDRIVGLWSLATVATLGVVWNHRLVFASKTLTALSLLALAGCAAGFVGLLGAVYSSRRVLAWVHGLPPHYPARGLVLRLAEVVAAYHGHIPNLLQAFAMSLPVHLLGCGAMLVCLRAIGLGGDMPASLVLFAFPLGMLAVAVPITPAGLGVGQAAFYAVCDMAKPGAGPAGSNGFTVYQALMVLIYLAGLIPYLAYRQSMPPAAELRQAEGA